MQADTNVTSAFGNSLQTSFAEIFSLVGAVVIIFAGYLLAKFLEHIVERALKKIHFSRLLQRAGVMEAVERSGTHVNPPRVFGNLTFWLVMLSVILLAANALGLNYLANDVRTLGSYVPNVIAAVVIMLVGSVLGGFVEGLIAASVGVIHGGRSLARTGRAGVLLLAIFMALRGLGIATDIVTTAFAILFGAIALAMALAFGLGNRELAGEVTREWYLQYRRERQEALVREQLEEERLDSDEGQATAAEPPSETSETPETAPISASASAPVEGLARPASEHVSSDL